MPDVDVDRIFTVRLDDSPGGASGSLAGHAISVKDNIDVAGVTTTAGSIAFRSRPPAIRDATVVKRLRSAGASIFAKTNMSEFAYSTLGVNAHYGTPGNPYPFAGEPRIPGGSSSGAAVAVALGLGQSALGTDTAGSSRIPAALCGVVGFKPRQRRISLDGIVPLSHSYDCVGILARSVRDVSSVFAVAADSPVGMLDRERHRRPYRVLVPLDAGQDDPFAATQEVGRAFTAAIQVLAADRRFETVRRPDRLFRQAMDMTADGGLVAPEAYAYHKPLLESLRPLYDPFTLRRLALGEKCTADRYHSLLARRRELMLECRRQWSEFDAVVYPTCPVIAPTVASIADPEARSETNLRLLQRTVAANVFDIASITVPCGHLGTPIVGPVGLSLDSCDTEERLLEIAMDLESALSEPQQHPARQR